MAGWAIAFFALAAMASLLGSFTLAGLASEVAKLLLFVFVVTFLMGTVANLLRGRTPPA
jgi:uncharacterized membrane protein YtjA (UPF0391 family)